MTDTIWNGITIDYIRDYNSKLYTNSAFLRIECSSTAYAYIPPTEINKETMKLLYLNGVIR